MEALRGEVFTEKNLADMLSTTNATLAKYQREHWNLLSAAKQAEARLAWQILENGQPLTKAQFDAMWLGISANLRGVKRAYRSQTGR